MLTKIGFKNFKRFQSMTITPIKQINLLTGINGCGKSTFLQSLLLMRQSPEHSRTTHQIVFNGSCVELGSFDDVKNSLLSRREPIELLFGFSKGDQHLDLHYILQENVNDDMVADIVELSGAKQTRELFRFIHDQHTNRYKLTFSNNSNKQSITSSTWYNLLFDLTSLEPFWRLFFEMVNFTKIHYISADRIGPREFYAKQSFTEFPNVGRRGEFTANILYKKRESLVQEKLRVPDASTDTVSDQVQAWLKIIFDGGKLNMRSTEANMLVLELNSDDTLNFYKPINVGFGYSYALPIIVSGLVAQPGEILIVENPEAHLHPFAQSQLTQFLARVSTCGVQVFIETHSDHVLNALRIAVLDQIVHSDQLNILYFSKKPDESAVIIPVNTDGSIEYWPDGFFDQTNKDFQRLFGI